MEKEKIVSMVEKEKYLSQLLIDIETKNREKENLITAMMIKFSIRWKLEN